MRRYERAHINEVWYGDTCYGPYLKIDGKKKRVYIQALIDDASRFIVGIDVFFNDTFVNLMSVMKTAVVRHGKPKILSFDNGYPYKNKQMDLLAARIGSVLNYNYPNNPVQKAKIERWFRTLRDQWMSQLNMSKFGSLVELRDDFMAYVTEYNRRIHSSLNGMTPQDRFFKESHLIKRLSDEQIDQYFLLEYERRVTADNVVMIYEVEYEVEYRYSRQKITLRYSPIIRYMLLMRTLESLLQWALL